MKAWVDRCRVITDVSGAGGASEVISSSAVGRWGDSLVGPSRSQAVVPLR